MWLNLHSQERNYIQLHGWHGTSTGFKIFMARSVSSQQKLSLYPTALSGYTHCGCSFRDTLCRTILLRQMSLLLDLWTSHIYQCKHPLKLSFLMGKMLLPSPPLLSSFTGAAEKACLGWWLITHLSLSLQWLICQPSCDHCHITVQPCHSTVVGPASLYCHFFHLLPQSNLSLHSSCSLHWCSRRPPRACLQSHLVLVDLHLQVKPRRNKLTTASANLSNFSLSYDLSCFLVAFHIGAMFQHTDKSASNTRRPIQKKVLFRTKWAQEHSRTQKCSAVMTLTAFTTLIAQGQIPMPCTLTVWSEKWSASYRHLTALYQQNRY